jgi:serine/threonine protein kinase
MFQYGICVPFFPSLIVLAFSDISFFFQQHISHPNITPLLAHLSTSAHHILVLPYLSGGDLLGLVNNDVAWGKLGKDLAFALLGLLLNG